MELISELSEFEKLHRAQGAVLPVSVVTDVERITLPLKLHSISCVMTEPWRSAQAALFCSYEPLATPSAPHGRSETQDADCTPSQCAAAAHARRIARLPHGSLSD